MRILTVIALVMAVPAVVAADSVSPSNGLSSWMELGLTGGFTDGPGYASKAPTAGMTLNTGSSVFRLRGGASGSLLHKSATPGGYWVAYNGGAELRFGRFSVFGGVTGSFTDQTIWTKRVKYAFGGTGFRWAGKRDTHGDPVIINTVQGAYYRETFSTYANHAQVYEASYRLYARLGDGPWYLQFGIALGPMYFVDNPYPGAAHRRGLSSNFGIGLALRP